MRISLKREGSRPAEKAVHRALTSLPEGVEEALPAHGVNLGLLLIREYAVGLGPLRLVQDPAREENGERQVSA